MFALTESNTLIAFNAGAENYVSSLCSTYAMMLVYYGLKDKIDSGKFPESILTEKNLSLTNLNKVNFHTTVIKIVSNPILMYLYYALNKNWPALIFILINLSVIMYCIKLVLQFLYVILDQMKAVLDKLRLEQSSQLQVQVEESKGKVIHSSGDNDPSKYDIIEPFNHNIPIEVRIAFMQKQYNDFSKIPRTVKFFMGLTVVSSCFSCKQYFFEDWNYCYYDTSLWAYTVNGIFCVLSITGFTTFVNVIKPPKLVTPGQVFSNFFRCETPTRQ